MQIIEQNWRQKYFSPLSSPCAGVSGDLPSSHYIIVTNGALVRPVLFAKENGQYYYWVGHQTIKRDIKIKNLFIISINTGNKTKMLAGRISEHCYLGLCWSSVTNKFAFPYKNVVYYDK